MSAIAGAGAASSLMTRWKQKQEHLRLTGGGGDVQDIIAQMQEAQDAANAANEARYQEMLGQFEGLGETGRARIQEQTAQQQASTAQDLTSRGLGGTTIGSAMSRGIAREGESATQELGERVAMQKAGAMERKTDQGPDMGMFANLISAMSQGQGSGGSAISGGMGPMARRGLTAFGQPFQYFNKPSSSGAASGQQARHQQAMDRWRSDQGV